jgi:geranylgeranyl pyrophosphate synthase
VTPPVPRAIAAPAAAPAPPPDALAERDAALAGFLARPGKRFRARLVELAFAAAGGRGDAGAALGEALERIHAGSLIVDDIQDGSAERRGGPALHVTTGVPAALNAGGWLYFDGLARLGAIAPDLLPGAVATLRTCHEGQALDLALRAPRLPRCEVPARVAEVTAKKTAALTELCARAGAHAAGGAPAAIEALAGLGAALGRALQLLDDVGAVASPARRAKGLEDLLHERPTWPWALAAEHGAARFAEAVALSDVHRWAELAALLAREAPRGRRRAAAWIDGALARVRAALPAGPALVALEGEVERLSAAYG